MAKTAKTKFQMPKLLKRILIITSIVLASIAIVAFILYKIFVTPEVKVMLSLLNAKDDVKTSFNFYIDDDEKNLLNYVSKESGTSTYNLTIEEAPMFRGVSASLTSTGNKKSSVTNLNAFRIVNIDVYTDKTETLVNLPLLDTGIRIPKKTKKEDWKDSAFADIYNTIPRGKQNEFIKFISDNDIDTTDFFKTANPQLVELIKKVDVSKKGSEKINIGGQKKKAEVFSINFSEADMNKLADIIEKYLKKQNITIPKTLRESLINFSKNNTVLFKIRNLELYEIEIINKNGQKYKLAFTGDKNQFDTTSYYENGKIRLSRVRTTTSGETTDVLTRDGEEFITLVRSKDSSSLVYKDDNKSLSVKAKGMKLYSDELSYDSLEIKLGDHFAVSGEYSLRKNRTDETVEFTKCSNYLDATKLSPEKWTSMVSSISGLFNRIPFF